MSSFDLVEVVRKLASLIRVGVVHKVRLSPYAVRVKSGNLVTAWLPVVVSRAGNNKSWDPLEAGEQVIILSPDGNPAQGWVLPAGYSQQHPAPESSGDKKHYVFADGARVEYDRKNHHFDINLPDGATVHLKASGGITLTGDLAVNGNIQATGNVSDSIRSMAEDRDIFNGHSHSGVMGGPSSTGTPEQSQ